MQAKGVLNLIFALVVVLFAAKVGLTAYAVHGTGKLLVTTSDPSASLAISGPNTHASVIGRGSSHIRLKPGKYFVSATDQGTTIMQETDVTAGQDASINLDINGRIKQQSKYNSLLAQLPFSGPAFSYSISYYLKYSGGESFPVLIITSQSEQAKQSALAWLQYNHYNPSEYQIIYKTDTSTIDNGNYYVGGQPAH